MSDKNNQLFNDIGKEITASLSEGLRSGDFSGLNRAISNSVDSVVKEAFGIDYSNTKKTSEYDARTYKEGSRTRAYQDRIANEHEQRRRAEQRRQAELAESRRRREAHLSEMEKRRQEKAAQRRGRNAVPATYKKAGPLAVPGSYKPIGNTLGTIFAVGGAVGMGVSAVNTIVNGVSGLFLSGSFTSFLTPLAFFFISLGIFGVGMYNKGMLARARRYAECSGEKLYVSIEELSSRMGMKPKSILRDIKRMLKRGVFPQGHLDKQETTLILSNSVYDEYLKTETQRERIEEEKNIIDMEEKSLTDKKDELESMMSEGIVFIERLRALNDKIPGEAISEKLSTSEKLLVDIFNCVKEHPEQMGRIHKLMEYYLPTMIKLVEAYAEYDRISAPGEEILKAKTEIENTLDKINEAFVQLLNNLFRDSVWDVTSDAKVLDTLLKQDGLR